MSLRQYLIGFVLALIISTVAILIFNIIRFPLSREAIRNKMSAENVITIAEYHGVIVYVTEVADDYIAYVFSESMIFNRFRLYWRPQYNYERDGAASFDIPGKRNMVIVRFTGRNITFPPPQVYNQATLSPRMCHISWIRVIKFYIWTYLGIMLFTRDVLNKVLWRNK